MRQRSDYFRRPLDWIFQAPGNVAVLRVLRDSKQGMSGRAIAREAGFTHRTVARAVADLEAIGLIDRQGSERTQLIRLDFRHRLVKEVLLPMFAGEADVMSGLRELLREEFTGKAAAVVLFGSAARGEARPGSDLDLLIVLERGSKKGILEIADALAERLKERYGVRLSLIVKTVSELRTRPRRSDPLLENILRDGVDLLDRRLEEILK